MNGGSITYPGSGKQLNISGTLAAPQQTGTDPMNGLFALLARKAMRRAQNTEGRNNAISTTGPIAQGVYTDPLTKAIQQNAMNADLAASGMDLTRMRQKMGPYVSNSNRPPLS
jgi:hypothetical protein